MIYQFKYPIFVELLWTFMSVHRISKKKLENLVANFLLRY
jgi:hypothetical protein